MTIDHFQYFAFVQHVYYQFTRNSGYTESQILYNLLQNRPLL